MNILFIQKVKALVGSEKYFLELIPALEKRGISTTFICIYNSADKIKTKLFITAYKALNLKIHAFEVTSDKSILKTLHFIRKTYKRDNFDLVHSHLIHADLWSTLLKRTRTIKCPIVSTKHGYDEMFISKHGFDGKLVKRNFYYRLCKFSEQKIKASFAVSNGLKQLFIDSKISDSNTIRTIHHGFDLPKLSENPSETLRLSSNHIIIVGRIIPFKGHEHALKALLIVKERIPNIQLTILGHGDEDLIKKLKTFVKVNNLNDNVSFLGYKSNIYDYLLNADLMIVPSIAEGFGLVFLEAMNAELPIVGFDVPATNEIVKHNESGLLISPYNTKEMGEEIANLLENKIFQKKLSQGAQQRLLSYFCLERMVSETEEFYTDALK